MQDLAGARIDLEVADRPRALGPVDPLDPRVAGVQERRPFGQIAHHDRVLEPGNRERVVPPESGRPHRRALGLGHTAVEVEDDRLHRRGRGGRLVLPRESPARDEESLDRLGVGCGMVEVALRDEANARIQTAWDVAGLRELQERVMDREAQGAPVGRDVSSRRRRVVRGERQERLDLGVAREGSGAGELQGRTSGVLLPGPLLTLDEGGRDLGVAKQEVGGIHEHRACRRGYDGKRRENRRRERFRDDARPLGIRDAASVDGLELMQEQAGARPIEAAQSETAELPAIERDLQ
jgi:hypothetical protein